MLFCSVFMWCEFCFGINNWMEKGFFYDDREGKYIHNIYFIDIKVILTFGCVLLNYNKHKNILLVCQYLFMYLSMIIHMSIKNSTCRTFLAGMWRYYNILVSPLLFRFKYLNTKNDVAFEIFKTSDRWAREIIYIRLQSIGDKSIITL